MIRGGRDLVIYPHGDGLLAVQCDCRPFVAKQLLALGLRLIQDGDHEKTFVFLLVQFEEVAAIVQPRRRRVISDERKAALAAMGQPFLFPKARHSRANLPSISHSEA